MAEPRIRVNVVQRGLTGVDVHLAETALVRPRTEPAHFSYTGRMPHAAESRRTPFAAVLRENCANPLASRKRISPERAGISPEAVSALERGTRTRPYPHTVRSLADGLGATEAERAALARRSPTSWEHVERRRHNGRTCAIARPLVRSQPDRARDPAGRA